MSTTVRSAKQRTASRPAPGDEGVLVLPWWRNPVNMVAIALAIALVFGAGGYTLGTRQGEVRGNDNDRGFLQDMRYHHENAVTISRVYLSTPTTDDDGATSDDTMRLIANTVELGQQLEIGRMIQLLRIMGYPEAADLDAPAMVWMGHPTPIERMPGLATDEQIDELGSLSGPAADALFASLMIAHHEAGILMAEELVGRGRNDETKAFAQAMIVTQRDDIADMERLGFS